MKKPGRVGDSLLSDLVICRRFDWWRDGSRSREDLMKGVISYEIVRLMKEALWACEKAVSDLAERLKRTRGEAGDISVVAMNAKETLGQHNIENFSFVVCHKYTSATVFRVHPQSDSTMRHELATKMAKRI